MMDEILLMFDSTGVEGGRITQQNNQDIRKIISDQFNQTGSGSIHNLDINITNHYIGSRWQTIVIVSGVLFFGAVVIYIMYRLCTITIRQVIQRHKGNRNRRRRRNRQEEAVNEILSNDGARQVLSSLARTAINSQANRRVRDFSSQASITSGGDVLDISERVVRVSFAPAVSSCEDDKSLGGESSLSTLPPAYDTLGTPPPNYPAETISFPADYSPPKYTDINPTSLSKNTTPTSSANNSPTKEKTVLKKK